MNKTRKTKIIATIGPASMERKVLRTLAKAGVDVIRLNLKYGSYEEHVAVIREAREIFGKQGKDMAVLLDFPKYNSKAGYELARVVGPEHIALSHIRKASEIDFARKKLEKENIKTNIITKIEDTDALKEFDSILASSEAVMIARGDLGRSIKAEYVPFVQKEIIQLCNKHKRFVIVATEMLLSMTENKRPTRAEASDVANAVIEGADAVMLSEETTIGKNPVEAVVMMDKIVREAEHWKENGHIHIYSSREKRFDFG